MNSDNILKLFKTKDLVIPSSLLSNRNKLNINDSELLLLSFLMSIGNCILLDLNMICDSLSLNANDVMISLGSLEEKGLIEMITKKEKIIKEYICIDNLYKKLVSFFICDATENKEIDNSIFSKFEQEFGRPLSPIEYEIIKSWIDSNINIDLIYEALKEAVLNNAHSIKYIERILIEWGRKGYKKPSDIIKRKDIVIDENIHIYDCDWLNDNE